MLGLACAAQEREVTKFLGIPVDGTKSEMIQKLKAKGFSPVSPGDDMLKGEFNGKEVYVSVVTNNNKVWRIMLLDVEGVGIGQIKTRFNNLVRQFANNSKYSGREGQEIPGDERISYFEVHTGEKQYEAVFYQGNIELYNEKLNSLPENREDYENLTPEMEKEIKGKLETITDGVFGILYREVWFKIVLDKDKFKICMYYDNKYNQANGEDL